MSDKPDDYATKQTTIPGPHGMSGRPDDSIPVTTATVTDKPTVPDTVEPSRLALGIAECAAEACNEMTNNTMTDRAFKGLVARLAKHVDEHLADDKIFGVQGERASASTPAPIDVQKVAEYERIMDWMTAVTWEGCGALMFADTEDGNIGVFVGGGENAKALGVGDEVEEALRRAVERDPLASERIETVRSNR